MAVLLVDDVASAEDVVQDAFMALHRHSARIREPQAALAYLRVSVINGARSTLRRRRTARRHDTRPESEPGADAGLMLRAEHQAVLSAVRTLPARQQEILVLRYWGGLSEAEIAGAMGISCGAVKSGASRAIDKLEKIIGGTW